MGELVTVASQLPGITEDEVNLIVAKLDRNGNASVDITEFIAALVMEQEDADERLIRKAFSKMDRNGDARVTKKELFSVLRQYSGSVETGEVSSFIGKTDEDGDQKIDYREFMSLFPQVRNKNEEQNQRMNDARFAIDAGPKCLTKFEEDCNKWVGKIGALRDKIEIACGV